MSPKISQFQVGGAVQVGSFYVERKADRELFSALMRGEFCYILAPRQIGKTSLRVRAAKRLAAEGVRCVNIDFTSIGSTSVSIDEWYFSIAAEIAEALDLANPDLFWNTHPHLTPVHRWYRYLRNELLDRTEEPVVIFIDEVESVLALAFSSDDFFASIRSAYNLRAEDPAYERLTFCLLGVAAPHDLISNSVRTPFNIGREIRLEDFTRAELDALRPGLEGLGGRPDAMLDAVFAWTSGHPYMSQKLCDDLVRLGTFSDKTEEARVDDSAYTLFIRNGRTADPNLAYAERRLDANPSRGRVRQMLHLYRRMLSGEKIPAEPNSPNQIELRLTGLAAEAREDSGEVFLRVRNLVFAEVYDHKWLKEKEKEQRLAELVDRWVASGRLDDYLLRGAALEDAVAWSHGRSDLTVSDREFLLAGLNAARREAEARHRLLEAAQEQEQARLAALEEQRKAERERYRADIERERRERAEEGAQSQRRTISILTGTVATIGVLLGVAVWQLIEAQLSQSQLAELSQRAQEEAQLEQQGAEALLLAQQAGKEREALIKAVKAAGAGLQRGREVPARVMQGLAAAVATPVQRPIVLRHEDAVFTAEFSHDGTRVLTASKDGKAHLWDAVSGQPSGDLAASGGPVLMASFTGGDARIFTVSGERSERIARLWNAATGEQIGKDSKPLLSQPRVIAGVCPDGAHLYYLGSDRTARTVEVQGGRARELSRPSRAPVTAIACSQGGGLVATAGSDGAVRLYDVESGELRVTLTKKHAGSVSSVEFSPLGDRLVSVGDDHSAQLWSVEGDSIAALQHAGTIGGAQFSANGATLLTWSDDRSAVVWAADTGKQLASFPESEPITTAALSPDGRRVATVGRAPTPKVWDVERPDGGHVTLDGHAELVRSIRFSFDSSRVLTASDDSTARLWNSTSGQLIATLEGHTAPVRAAVFAPDGNRLLTVSDDNTARLWDGTLGNTVPTLKGHAASVRVARFSPDGSRIVTASDDKTARLWDAATTMRPLRTLEEHTGPVRAAVFAGDGSGRMMTWADDDPTLRVWDSFSGDQVAALVHAGAVLGASFSRDGKRIYSAGADDTLRLWDVATGARIGDPFQGSRGAQSMAAFAPGGRYALLANRDSNTAQLYDAEGFRFINDLVGHSGPILDAVFTPDGEKVVTISSDNTAKLWGCRYGSEIETLDPASGAIQSAAFSRDGGRLVLATARDAWVYAVPEIDEKPGVLATLQGHSASLLHAAFSPDGRRLVTASSDNTAKLWDASRSYELLATLHGHAAAVNHAEFSPDGRQIVTAGRDGRIQLFPTTLEAFLRKACERLRENDEFLAEVDADCRLVAG